MMQSFSPGAHSAEGFKDIELILRDGLEDIGTLPEILEARLAHYGAYAEPTHERLCPVVPEYAERLGKLLVDEDHAQTGRPFVREAVYLGVVIAERTKHPTYSADTWLDPTTVPEGSPDMFAQTRATFMRELLTYSRPRFVMRQLIHRGLRMREIPREYEIAAFNATAHTLFQADLAARQAHIERMDKMLFGDNFDPFDYQMPDQPTAS